MTTHNVNDKHTHIMKRILYILSLVLTLCTPAMKAQNSTQAYKALEKTANVIGRTGGSSASFTLSGAETGTVSGTITIKGKKFHASTPQAIVWFDGSTQWTLVKRNNEVNISRPTLSQQQMMNPYTFINLYKQGYDLSMTTKGSNNVVHLVAKNKTSSIPEMYVTANKNTGVPSVIKMKHRQKWTTITIKNFRSGNFSNSTFTFNAKDFPSAEIIDLR